MQVINYSKSMFISKNTHWEVFSKIQEALGICYSTSLGQYLGLPSQISKSKCQVFSNLKDQIWKLLQGSKEKLFPRDDKEVLINVVTQAIPIYTMSRFRLLREPL